MRKNNLYVNKENLFPHGIMEKQWIWIFLTGAENIVMDTELSTYLHFASASWDRVNSKLQNLQQESRDLSALIKY